MVDRSDRSKNTTDRKVHFDPVRSIRPNIFLKIKQDFLKKMIPIENPTSIRSDFRSLVRSIKIWIDPTGWRALTNSFSLKKVIINFNECN